MNHSIYFHFFDRELRKSVNANLGDAQLLNVCCLSVFMTDNILYLPISNLYESGEEFPQTAELIQKMDKAGLVYPASSHNTREGFILSRQEYYSHDPQRYAMYFEKEDNLWSPNLLCLKESTTVKLQSNLQNDIIDIKELNGKNRDEVRKIITHVLSKRGHRAITFALFNDNAKNSKLSDTEMRVALEYIKRRISVNYSNRYLEIQDGSIITGISGIQQYDYLAKDEFETNFPIYQTIFNKCGVDTKSEEGRKLLFDIRMDNSTYRYIYIKVQEIISLLKNNIHDKSIAALQAAKNILQISCNYSKATTGLELFTNLEKYIIDICRNNKFERGCLNMLNDGSIVLIAVTSKEMKVMIKKVREYFPSNMIIERVEKNLIYRELVNEKQKVYFVQSEMGNVGVGSIVNTVHLISDELNPRQIIMGGIAFGSDSQKQKIGDILVSKQVWYYERTKIEELDIIDRGDKLPASAWLLRLFRSSELEYDKANIHFGLIASGEKLINSPEMMGQLKTREPELIGGDMEAAGLVSVCEEKKIEWIFAKGICDWGMNKDSSGQVLAAENAFDFIMYNLRKMI